MEPTKWYLISKEDADEVRDALLESMERDTSNEQTLKAALHTLDSGLYTTNAVPDDWKEDAGEADS